MLCCMMKYFKSTSIPQVLPGTFFLLFGCTSSSSHSAFPSCHRKLHLLSEISLRSYITCSDKLIGQIHILRPQRPELRKCKIQPRLSSAIEMNDCSFLRIYCSFVLLIPKSQHVPIRINDMNVTMKRYQAWWQGPQLPKTQI